MFSPEEKRRLAELYSLGHESFFCDALLAELHQRERPAQALRDFRHGCYRQAKEWLKANQPKYPFLPPA